MQLPYSPQCTAQHSLLVGFVDGEVTVSEGDGIHEVCIQSIASGAINTSEPDVPFTITVNALSTAQGTFSISDLLNKQLFFFLCRGPRLFITH